MPKPPQEVQPEFVTGTNAADLLLDNQLGIGTQVNGLGGDDLIMAYGNESAGAGIDLFDGGSGSDTVSYLWSANRITASLIDGQGFRIQSNGAWTGKDLYASIENLTGSAHNDALDGNHSANVLHGSNGNDVLYGGTGADQLAGNEGNDRLEGGDENDVLDGGTGNDQLFGQGGNDTLTGGTGNDRIDGGTGIDTAVFNHTTGLTVILDAGYAATGSEVDQLVDIEHVTTGNGNDAVTGTNGGETIRSRGGNDAVYAYAGNDTIEGGDGNDLLAGYEGNDVLDGGNDNDRLFGGANTDSLTGGSGNDLLKGEAGTDSLSAGTGNDLVLGGEGNDWISTGSGSDVIRWENGDLGIDTIADFQLGIDRLSFGADFLAVDATPANLDLSLIAAVNGANTDLYANLDWGGWQKIAVLQGVFAGAVQDRIEDGSILAVSLTGVGGGAPGGFQAPQPDPYL